MEETRRERKRRQTRRLLLETALRLFDEQGYAQTTVAQIAAAADVATKTFFNHFPSKEDVLFDEVDRTSHALLSASAEPRPGESVADLLTRILGQLIESYWQRPTGLEDPELSALYLRVLMRDSFLQAKALQVELELRAELVATLTRSFPQLDPVDAAAAVGALVGATSATGLAAIEAGGDPDSMRRALDRGVEIAIQGLRTL